MKIENGILVAKDKIELPQEFKDYIMSLSKPKSQESIIKFLKSHEMFLMSKYEAEINSLSMNDNGIIGLFSNKIYIPKAKVNLKFVTENINIGAKPIIGRFFLDDLLSFNLSIKLPKHFNNYIFKIAKKLVDITLEENKDEQNMNPIYKNILEELGYLKRQVINYHCKMGEDFTIKWYKNL